MTHHSRLYGCGALKFGLFFGILVYGDVYIGSYIVKSCINQEIDKFIFKSLAR